MTAESSVEQTQGLIDKINSLSLGAAHGNRLEAEMLLWTFVPIGPDEGPEVRVTPELLRSLDSRQALAVEIAHMFFSKLGRNIIWSEIRPKPSWEWNQTIRQFYTNIGRTIHGIINPDGPFGQNVIESMIQTNEAYQGMIKQLQLQHRSS